jgi:hypothetical protein
LLMGFSSAIKPALVHGRSEGWRAWLLVKLACSMAVQRCCFPAFAIMVHRHDGPPEILRTPRISPRSIEFSALLPASLEPDAFAATHDAERSPSGFLYALPLSPSWPSSRTLFIARSAHVRFTSLLVSGRVYPQRRQPSRIPPPRRDPGRARV